MFQNRRTEESDKSMNYFPHRALQEMKVTRGGSGQWGMLETDGNEP